MIFAAPAKTDRCKSSFSFVTVVSESDRENDRLTFVSSTYVVWEAKGRSFIYMQKSKGERMTPYGTPWKTDKGWGGGVGLKGWNLCEGTGSGRTSWKVTRRFMTISEVICDGSMMSNDFKRSSNIRAVTFSLSISSNMASVVWILRVSLEWNFFHFGEMTAGCYLWGMS